MTIIHSVVDNDKVVYQVQAEVLNCESPGDYKKLLITGVSFNNEYKDIQVLLNMVLPQESIEKLIALLKGEQ